MSKKPKMTFMGQEVVEKKGNEFAVSKSGQKEIMESLGVTEEVQKTVRKAERELAFNALEFVGDICVKTKERTRLSIGSGGTKRNYTMVPVKENRKPTDGTMVTTYGSFSVGVSGVTPGDADFVKKHDDYRAKLQKVMKKK